MILACFDAPGTRHWLVPVAVVSQIAIIPHKEMRGDQRNHQTGTTELSPAQEWGKGGTSTVDSLIIDRFFSF
jgi:hypothetical protein